MSKIDEIEQGLETDDSTLEWTVIRRDELRALLDYVRAFEKLHWDDLQVIRDELGLP